QIFVVYAQPVDKGQHLLVAPHPGREALKGWAGLRRRSEVTDVTVDPRRIGPVGLDRDDGEAMIDDQALRDRGAGTVELRGAVRRLAEQHDPRVAEPVEKSAECLGMPGFRQLLPVPPQQRGDLLRLRT